MDYIIDLIIKPLFVFGIGFLVIYILGKKTVAAMNNFELFLIVIIAGFLSSYLATEYLLTNFTISILLILLYLLLSFLLLKTQIKEKLGNTPVVLIKNGSIDKQALKKIRMSVEDLLSELRIKGFTNPKDLALVTYENNGLISAIPVASKRPLQPNDIQLQPTETFIPIPIIVDGEIIDINLQYLKKDKLWLNQQLKAYELNLDQIANVTLAVYTQEGTLEVDLANKPNYNPSSPYQYKPGMEQG